MVPYVFSIGEGDKKIVTRTIAIETSVRDADETKQRMYKAFAKVPEKWKYSNSMMYRFFPFRTTSDIPHSAIQEFAKAQNKFLHSVAEIPVYNIASLEWIIPGKGVTFRELLMESVHPVTKEKLCFAIERTNNEEKYFVIVNQKYRTYVQEWMSQIADGLEKVKEFGWEHNTLCTGRYRFTFKEQNAMHRQYSRDLLHQINPNTEGLDEIMENVTLPPPKKRNRNKTISYGRPPNAAWNNSDETMSRIASHTERDTTLDHTRKKENKKGSEIGSREEIQFDDKANALEKRLLDRIKKVNSTVEDSITKIRTTSNNTNYLVQQMLDNHEKLLEENRERDLRIDLIQQGMSTNNEELIEIREEATKNVKKITKILTLLYNNLNPDAQANFDDWEYDDSSTLDEILSMQGSTIRQDKKRKTSEPKEGDHTQMDLENALTQPTPATTGLSGVGRL